LGFATAVKATMAVNVSNNRFMLGLVSYFGYKDTK